MRLRWEDIDFQNGRMEIHSTKTEHHKDGGIRSCPLFPELRPYLVELHKFAKLAGAGEPSDFVIAKQRGSAAILRTGLMRILKRAGIKPWPKLFHNMRASRETELLDDYPIKDVCSWIGNTQAVAMKHYAMMRESSFARAAGFPAEAGDLAHEIRGPVGGPVNGDSSHLEAETAETAQVHKTKKPQVFPRVGGFNSLEATTGILPLMGEEGLEPPTSTL